jgi:integrase
MFGNPFALPNALLRSRKSILMARIIYAEGLRLNECLQLRIKDIDLNNLRLTVRETKSNRDRYTILAESLVQPIKNHIAAIRSCYEADLKNGTGVSLPTAIDRKYRHAHRAWAWH